MNMPVSKRFTDSKANIEALTVMRELEEEKHRAMGTHRPDTADDEVKKKTIEGYDNRVKRIDERRARVSIEWTRGISMSQVSKSNKSIGRNTSAGDAKGKGKGCCRLRSEEVLDNNYRLQEIRLPLWAVYLARFSHIWEILLYLMTVITFGLITFTAFFAFYEEHLANIIFALDVVFNLDILMRLAVEIWRYRNQVTVVIFTVPYSMFQYLLDLITIIPFHQLFIAAVPGGIDDLENLSKVDFFRFNRFIRLYRSHRFFQTLQEDRSVNEKIIFLLRFTNYYIGFIHLTSCLLMFITGVQPLDYLLKRNRNKLDTTWMRVVNTDKFGYPTEKPADIYALVTSMATATVTTVGYGDLSATNEVEMAWCIFFMLFGAIFLNGYFTSQLTTFELELDGARFDLFFRVNETLKYLKSVGTLPLFDAKVEEYYNYLWTYREGVYEVLFMQKLPLAFQEDLLFDICQEMFDKSFLFNGIDEALLRAVAKIVKVALYNPKMILCRKGGYANKMYYILQGECQVISKYENKPAAILRAGSIIGESNLFFSYPYTSTIETRTCCQFIILEKEELIIAMDDFRDQLTLLRAKSQAKIMRLYDTHELYGVEPVCWVEVRNDVGESQDPDPEAERRTMRWGSRFNRKVTEDVIDDTQDCVIFDTPCHRTDIVKNHLTPYMTCTVPEIMDADIHWVPYWNMMNMIIAMVFAFIGPYCVAFGHNSDIERTMCQFQETFVLILVPVYIADVFVEIVAACPVYGYYYKFWDGLKVKKYEFKFYLDILAAIPFSVYIVWVGTCSQCTIKMVDTVFKSLKLWKVIRYLHFLDNRYPLQLFWFRLSQTILVLMYGIHFIACISFLLACIDHPQAGGSHEESLQVCHEDSWLRSYERRFEGNSEEGGEAPSWMRMETLRDTAPYLYSVFYSAATLTSAGFGDFNPQRSQEMLFAIAFQLIGFYLIGYYTSTLTSALSCVVRPKLAFQQKLISVNQFMRENHLKELLRDRIIEYFYLQNHLRGGITLGRGISHMMYDCPEYLRHDVFYLELVDLLDGIPVFSKVDADVIIKMSSFMKRFLIPPNTTFLRKGEIRRVMYLIKEGSVGIFGEDSDKPINILEHSSHFGIRDLLFGEPCHFTVKSLSHVSMYSIKIHQVQQAMGQDDEFWDLVNQERETVSDPIDEMIKIYSHMMVGQATGDVDTPSVIVSWTKVPPRIENHKWEKDKNENVPKKQKRQNREQNREYDELFKQVRLGRHWKWFLMRRTVHPVGLFAKIWNCVLSTQSFLMLVCMCIETFMGYRAPGFRIFQWLLDCFPIIDLYVKMHWGYFHSEQAGCSILISHPLKTAINYILHGTFVMDIMSCLPVEMILPIIGWTNVMGYGNGATWYTKLRWIRVLQIKRLSIVFEIGHTIFKHRNAVLLALYVTATILLCTLLGSVSLYTACPWSSSIWQENDEYKMPICLHHRKFEDAPEFWATIKSEDAEQMNSLFDRLVLSIYYVSQVVLVIGFGDLITLRKMDIIMLIFMQVFGFVFVRCIIADVTAAEVDSDEIRAEFLEHLETFKLVMLREGIPKRLQKNAIDHLMYVWRRSKGIQPRDLFSDLHPALESDLFRELVGKELAKVHLFNGFTANIIRTISGFLKKVYFRKGQRIMRCGNLEYEMTIIIRGKVFICDMHYNYLCTLSAGDCFGEGSMLHKKRRCYNAVAMNNVEVYYMTSSDFDLVFERYPKVRNKLEERLGGGERDLFEQALYDKMELAKHMTPQQHKGLIKSFAVRRDMIIAALRLRENLRNIHDSKPLPWYHWSKVYGYGIMDDYLPFLYFCKARYRDKGDIKAILLHPRCGFAKLFRNLLVLLSYVSAAFATYEICFIPANTFGEEDEKTSVIVKISKCVEYIFIFDLFLKFITPFEAAEGVFCKTYRGIFLRYVTDPSQFLLDFIGCVPWIVDDIIITYQDLQASNLKYIYLLKIARLVRYYQHQFARGSNINISTFSYKITISVSSFCLMAHMLACVFYDISKCEPSRRDETNGTIIVKRNVIVKECPKDEVQGNTWTHVFQSDNGLDDSQDQKLIEWKWYIRSLYWVVTTVSTTGFGDILPYTVYEMIVAIISIFCGAFILSIILSDFTSGMASLTKANREYMYQVQLLVKHLRNIGLSQTRQDQVMMHFLMMWKRCRGTSYNKATVILPISLRIEVCNALFGKCLRKVSYFQGYDENSFVRQLSLRVRHSIYMPGVYIVKEGDQGKTMFIVFKGLISATKIPDTTYKPQKNTKKKQNENENTAVHENKQKRSVESDQQLDSVYNVGDVFGRFPALFRDECYKKSYRAECRTEVLELDQKDIQHLAKKFPYFERSMKFLIHDRYDINGPGQHIFSDFKKYRENLFDLGEDFKTKPQPHPHPRVHHPSNGTAKKSSDERKRVSGKSQKSPSTTLNKPKNSTSKSNRINTTKKDHKPTKEKPDAVQKKAAIEEYHESEENADKGLKLEHDHNHQDVNVGDRPPTLVTKSFEVESPSLQTSTVLKNGKRNSSKHKQKTKKMSIQDKLAMLKGELSKNSYEPSAPSSSVMKRKSKKAIKRLVNNDVTKTKDLGTTKLIMLHENDDFTTHVDNSSPPAGTNKALELTSKGKKTRSGSTVKKSKGKLKAGKSKLN